MSDPKKRLDDLVGGTAKFAGLLATVVGIPSLLFTCSSQQAERSNAFQNVVAAEEARWLRLHDQYFDALGKKNEDPGVFDSKLQLICLLSREEPRQLGDFALGGLFPEHKTQRHEAASRSLLELRNSLHKALRDAGTGSDGSRECVREQGRLVADATNQQQREAGGDVLAPPALTESAAVKVAAQAAVESKQLDAATTESAPASLVVSAGDAKGYDIDVFWCAGGAYLNDARGVVKRLSSQPSLGEGALQYRVGRVRLRSISPQTKATPRYRNQSYTVSAERGEEQQAGTLVGFLNAGRSSNMFAVIAATAIRSPWYLSVFVCPPTPAEPQPPVRANTAEIRSQ